MVSTSEVVCNTSTPRDMYFSLYGFDGAKTIVEDSALEASDKEGYFWIDRKKKRRCE